MIVLTTTAFAPIALAIFYVYLKLADQHGVPLRQSSGRAGERLLMGLIAKGILSHTQGSDIERDPQLRFVFGGQDPK